MRISESAPELEAVLPQLLADWRVVLSKLMLAGTQDTWQSDLIDLVVPGGISSFPQVQTPVGTYANSGSVSTHTVPLPASVTAGDLLFVALTTDYHADIAVPSGWSRIWNDTITGEIRFGGYVKVADGSESGGNVVFTVSGTEPGAAQVFRVAAGDWYGDLSGVEASVVNKANSTNITLPALAPSWGNAKTLWFAAAAHEEDNALDSVPSSFGDLERTPSGAGTGNVTVLTARQELEVASMSPGSFVIVGANNWISVTVAIRPADAENAAQEAVVGAHFDSAGDFERMLDALVNDGSLTQDQADDLLFVVELYQRVDQYYPIVAVLYNDKAGRGWKTVDDLASVKLRSGSSGSGWEYYASAQQSYSNGAFPGDIPGKNASEKIEIYAQRLYDKFGGAAAQTRFVSAAAEIIDGTEPPGFADAIAFLSDHPDFDLSATPIDKYLADEGITLTDEVVAQLKQLQRVYRVSPDFDVALTLVTEGLDSAVKIAQHDEDQFVADFEEKLGGLTVARSVHRKAKHYSGEIFATLVTTSRAPPCKRSASSCA